MKDILLRHRDNWIECELDGDTLTYTYSDEPTFHVVLKLKDAESYAGLKCMIRELYESFEDSDEGYGAVSDFLQSYEMDKFLKEGSSYCYSDLRTREEIEKYEKEACDKVWLMRSYDIKHGKAMDSVAIPGINRIMSAYSDIPRDGYSDWYCGYWNGIMGALRWVLGDEKDYLDT